MSEAVVLVLLAGVFSLLGALLTPVVVDAMAGRRARIKERTEAREREAEGAMEALRDAMDAKDDLIQDLRQDRDFWREHSLRTGDGWYGQRRQT